MTSLLIRLFIKNAGETKNPAVRGAYGRMAGLVGICCNLILSAAKMLTGFLLGSMAILADGLNNLSDLTSSLITLIGFKMSGRPADREHPYGHARSEYVAGLVVAFFIMIVGFNLMTSSFDKIRNPEPVDFTTPAMLLLMGSILLKLWMSRFNRKIGRLVESATLEATAQDSLNDVFTTSGVLACALISRFTSLNLDGWVGLAMAVFILVSGVKMVNETLSPLLGEAPGQELVEEFTGRLRSYAGVLGIHDLLIHDYGPGRCFASVHVEMDARADIMECHDAIDQIERDFLEEGIHLVIHLDPVVTDDEEVNALRQLTARQLASMDMGLTMHDFRVVKGKVNTKLLFDVVVPYDCKHPEEVRNQLENQIHAQNPHLFAEIQVDRSFTG